MLTLRHLEGRVAHPVIILLRYRYFLMHVALHQWCAAA